MRIIIDDKKRGIINLARELGYRPLDVSAGGEFNLIRPVRGDDYPRFHIYAKEEGGKIVFNLHLDQKKPSYQGSPAHSGEYEGELIEKEAERIKELIK